MDDFTRKGKEPYIEEYIKNLGCHIYQIGDTRSVWYHGNYVTALWRDGGNAPWNLLLNRQWIEATKETFDKVLKAKNYEN